MERIYKTTRVPDGDEDTAASIVTDHFTRPAIILLSQKEMLRSPDMVENTTAGKLAIPEGRLGLDKSSRGNRRNRR